MSWNEHTQPVNLPDRYGDVEGICAEKRRQRREMKKLERQVLRRARRQEFIEGSKSLFRRIFG